MKKTGFSSLKKHFYLLVLKQNKNCSTSFGQQAAALFHEQNTQLIYKKNYRYFETTVQLLNLKYNMPIS